MYIIYEYSSLCVWVKIAQRCFAAIGNASKMYYLSEMMRISDDFEETHGPGVACPEVQARFAMLKGDLRWESFTHFEK